MELLKWHRDTCFVIVLPTSAVMRQIQLKLRLSPHTTTSASADVLHLYVATAITAGRHSPSSPCTSSEVEAKKRKEKKRKEKKRKEKKRKEKKTKSNQIKSNQIKSNQIKSNQVE